MGIDHRLACYGTLVPGRANHHQLAGLTGTWRPGQVRGTLLATGWGAARGYPALFPDPAGDRVAVQLFESPDLPAHWDRLDDFEGSDYVRVPVEVETADGLVTAWLYAGAPKD